LEVSWVESLISGSVRFTAYLSRPLDLGLFAKELAKNGLWVANVLPKADGTFEILSPEPGMIAFKPGNPPEVPAYKLYATPDAKSLTLFGDSQNFKDYLSELVGMLEETGFKEDEIVHVDMAVAVEDELELCPIGKLSTEFLGEMEVDGFTATGKDFALAVVPLNKEKKTYLITLNFSEPWDRAKKHSIVLQPLYEELKEVVKRWSCQR